MPTKAPDPVRLEVFHHLLAAVCEESGALLQRSAISPNIRERLDFSYALFDDSARLIAQAAHIPVHLGSAADSVHAARAAFSFEPGDVAVLNDPYAGGTHLPDITMVRPVFLGSANEPAFFLANRAHHADVGGAVPGSMGIAHDLHGEGLVIPPVKWRVRGETQRDVEALIRANVRDPGERSIDLEAQAASLALGEQRLRELCDEFGRDEVARYAGHLMDASAKIVRSVIRGLKPGTFRARETMEGDGTVAGPFRIALELEVKRDRLVFDFTATDDQARGGINANRSIVMAAALYVVRCLCPARLPTNDGVFRALEIRTRSGSLVDPIAPAPVAGGNVETSQRLVDVCVQALDRASSQRLPAQSAGTMSNVTFGGVTAEGAAFTIYETLPGGAGATRRRDGHSAVQTHMTNTRNTPVEEFEHRYPLEVASLTVRRGSGGRGKHRGGDGIVKEVVVREPTMVSLFAERHECGARGAAGGGDGKPGRAWVVRDGRKRRIPAKVSLRLEPGDRVRIETPGGGGHGRP
ncbi:MAG: hydantoinase B/oxoprolinase family protein [Planctomycetes bacterium]|nr:hydantoinase B/oxoprolinase family protein [Planctomycetota bacterium]